MATTVAIPLRPTRAPAIRGEVLNSVDIEEHAAHFDDAPPETAAVDLRPSRQYQMLLVLSGFIMIFHVIGINSIYGLFQVSSSTAHCCSQYESLAFSGVLRIFLNQHQRCARSGGPGFARRNNRKWLDLERWHLRQSPG